LDIPEGGEIRVDHILERFMFNQTNVTLFNKLVDDILPEDSDKTINVIHLINGLLRGLDVNYENDNWYIKIKNKVAPFKKNLDYNKLVFTSKKKLKDRLEKGLKDKLPNIVFGKDNDGIDEIKEK